MLMSHRILQNLTGMVDKLIPPPDQFWGVYFAFGLYAYISLIFIINKMTMKLLTYTSLNELYSNHEIKGSIALYSIFIELTPLKVDQLTLNEEGVIVYQQKTDKELNCSKPSKKIIIPQGTYSVDELETLIKQHIPQFTLSLNKERTLDMYIGINTHVTFTKNMLKLIGIKEILEGHWLSLGPHFGRKKIIKPVQTVNTIYLYCKQLLKSTHLIDGKHTNCFYTTPLLINQTVIFHSPAKLIYLPVEYPTRYLKFKILDQNGKSIPIKNIILQVLNKYNECVQ